MKNFLTSFNKSFFQMKTSQNGWLWSKFILFVIHREKVEESTHRTIFTNGSKFGQLGSKTFWKQCEASNDIFGSKTLFLKSHIPSFYSTQIHVSNYANITSIGVHMERYATWKLTFLFQPPWFESMPCQTPLFMEKILTTWSLIISI